MFLKATRHSPTLNLCGLNDPKLVIWGLVQTQLPQPTNRSHSGAPQTCPTYDELALLPGQLVSQPDSTLLRTPQQAWPSTEPPLDSISTTHPGAVSPHVYLWAWSPDRQAPWHQVQAPVWLQASGEGSRRQGSGGRVRASRRPRATPPKPPEIYRRPPTAATAWATDSSIGDPTEAGPGERQKVQRERTGDWRQRFTHRSQSERDAGQRDGLRRAETDKKRQGEDRQG